MDTDSARFSWLCGFKRPWSSPRKSPYATVRSADARSRIVIASSRVRAASGSKEPSALPETRPRDAARVIGASGRKYPFLVCSAIPVLLISSIFVRAQ